ERERAPRIATNGGVLWCSCDSEKIGVKIGGPSDGRRALGWMSVSNGSVGGVEALSAGAADAFPLVTDFVPQACRDAAFHAWAHRAGQGEAGALDAARPGPTADFIAEGFEPVSLFPGERGFVVIRAKQGRCYVAAPEKGKSEIELRAAEGARLVSRAGGAV